MTHRQFKHTGFGEDPPFRYVSPALRKPQGSVAWLVARILLASVAMTLVAFFAFKIFYAYHPLLFR